MTSPMADFTFCEPVRQTGTRWHIRALDGGGPRPNGGIPDGTAALCGADMSRGWDVTHRIRPDIVRGLLARNREARVASEQHVHEPCATAYLAFEEA